ncbi:Rieske 2Fe-2S domain-containing protein [Maribellus sp. YY47]|uniref:Rieske 2Fe-2S domain-containing protein n=1 Tax=Maribellus sp. YY47 TaxID=2929486 RepID=UPI0020016FCB|nr:Rieske 2Fe-2S domain-containing protein [Maribellus sp. YY47]MCK3683852.1 Rieske 2Fe-2S domain-containing protein [Maribellus sp. YY47]
MKQLILRSGKYLFFFMLVLLSSLSCKEIDSQIPEVPVSFQVNLNIYNELRVPGNSAYFPQAGFGGVVVYCELEGSYYAFDAACTNEINTNCRVENKGLVGTCSCCQSEFVFVGGNVVKGPASAPLKQYNVSLLGDMLRVYN